MDKLNFEKYKNLFLKNKQGFSKMLVFKRKQVVSLSLILMVVVAGYLQYNYKDVSILVNANSTKENGKLGEAVYVDGENISSMNEGSVNKEEDKETKKQDIPKASKQAEDFFAQAKLDKDTSRGKDKESLKAIIDDKNASNEIKKAAYDKMMKLVANAEKEMKIETLIKEKGFADAVVLFGDDGSADIVLKSPDLNSVQTTQIADIASRQAAIKVSDIHIRNIY